MSFLCDFEVLRTAHCPPLRRHVATTFTSMFLLVCVHSFLTLSAVTLRSTSLAAVVTLQSYRCTVDSPFTFTPIETTFTLPDDDDVVNRCR